MQFDGGASDSWYPNGDMASGTISFLGVTDEKD
jgi:hypothetical protein